ncbi:MAG: glycosyltransferase [Patescibacteria group bacterium]
MRIVVVIPTYNERENTEKMIDTLAGVFSQIKNHEMNLLYVDGNSPDGTGDAVKKKQEQYKWLHLMVETKKEGLGMAYAKGMQYAMDQLKADYIMEFDGDFQHRPQDLPLLVGEIDNNYDYIIGSRYIPGGSIPSEWGFDRKLLSVVGNLVARTFLILPHLHDVTTGFKLARVKGFMDQFDFSTLLSKSFAYKVHLLFYMVNKGARVKEVPIRFMARTSGESKIIKNEMKETLRVIFLLQLYNPKIQKIIKFGIVGFAGYIVNSSTLYLFTKLNWPGWAAWGLSAELAILNNFTWNNLWTFRDQQISGLSALVSKFLQFNITSTGGILIMIIVGVATDYLIGSQYRQIVLPLTIAFLVMPYNYLMYTWVIWRKKASNPK